jgi:hypothetical protein
MSARLLFRERFVYSDGAIREMVLWKVLRASRERPHGLKYRLFYGAKDGSSAVRYDNEAGEGEHRHCGDHEEPYIFVSVERLVSDFLADIAAARGGDL